jgi:hypothetical protein
MKVYTKDIKRQAKRSLAWVLETDSILIKGKRERFLKRQTGCLKRFDGIKLNHRKYISISEVISLSYTSIVTAHRHLAVSWRKKIPNCLNNP